MTSQKFLSLHYLCDFFLYICSSFCKMPLMLSGCISTVWIEVLDSSYTFKYQKWAKIDNIIQIRKEKTLQLQCLRPSK